MKERAARDELMMGALGNPRYQARFRRVKATMNARSLLQGAAASLVLMMYALPAAQAQSSYAPVVITPPVEDLIDENHVSLMSGRPQFTIPAIKLGDVSFTPYSTSGEHFVQGQIMDHNYGRIAQCQPINPTLGSSGGAFECATVGPGLQAIYGEERATFTLSNGQYTPTTLDGSTFVDAGGTCVWTKKDGTQIVYVAYHVSGNPLCQSNNISQIISPDGRVTTYYYYGTFSTTYWTQSPILSVVTNSGYLLKYIYSGTPTAGGEASVVALNRAFVACDPAAVSCSYTGSWPTATLSWQNKEMSVSDNFLSTGPGYDPFRHYIFTIQDEAHKSHVFELDSWFRVISYQPPEATTPVYFYSLCSILFDDTTMQNCFGYTSWPHNPNVFEPQPLLIDLVNSVTRNSQTWTYSDQMSLGAPPGYSTWGHSVANPLGRSLSITGNATTGTENLYGPTELITHYDGTVDHFDRDIQNFISSRQSPAGMLTQYAYGSLATGRGNLQTLTVNPIPGSGQSAISQSATYPPSCTNIVTCNKPTSVTDANLNTASFTYDPTHGGVLTVTGPAVNGVQPQTRYTYLQRNAWYLSSAGVMTRDSSPIWLRSTESYCISGPPATSGTGCALANDEVLTSYDYGPDSGPNNLLLRGKTVSSRGQTLRTCYAHDLQGNKIWETSPNAGRSSCPDY
jgi:hypothetical protein